MSPTGYRFWSATPPTRTDAARILAGGGLRPDHLPVLAAAGITQFHVGSPVRPGGSWSAPVDAALVRTWRDLVDAATRPTGGGVA